MLTQLRTRNFKRFEEVDIELGPSVLFIGPNNSGKTTALQALALWAIGRDRWCARRNLEESPSKRPGVAINRRDLVSLPTPQAKFLWRGLRLRDSLNEGGRQRTRNVRIDVILQGVTRGQRWTCGFEFDYTNEESFVCRPVREAGSEHLSVREASFTEVPKEALDVQIAFLPPMSGLAAEEPKWEPGRIKVLIGQGQTAQVLRNLCFQLHDGARALWDRLVEQIDRRFGVTLVPPDHVEPRGEVTMQYRERGGVTLDLSCAGRGLQQTTLLLAYLYSRPGCVLLLDEPDAHLEILRQRQTWQLLTETAETQGSQVIAASHSEVLLNEAADNDMVIAFVGDPHRVDARGGSHQVRKALREISFDHYYQAEESGWVLYLEGETDLAILRALAKKLQHPARAALERPFFLPIRSNTPSRARNHFYALREAVPTLRGISIFDRLDRPLRGATELVEHTWRRREIENYLCIESALIRFAGEHDLHDDLFGRAEGKRRVSEMRVAIGEIAGALNTLGKPGPWSPDIKASDEFLAPLFEKFYARLDLPNAMQKRGLHVIARYLEPGAIDSEVCEKLDAIAEVGQVSSAST